MTARVFRAPGRVNLIGSHTDFQEGWVLPVALPLEVHVAAEAAPHRVRVTSASFAGAVDVPADGSAGPAGGLDGWGRYIAGVVWALAELGRPPAGLSAHVTSTVPAGAGLASSAALEVGVAAALAAMAGWTPPAVALAEACQRAEVEGAGVPCGIMDQLVAVVGSAGGAVLVDCRTRATTPVALPRGWSVLVVDSGARRELSASAYQDRRADVERGARQLAAQWPEVRALRDATLEMVETLPEPERRRCRHVVTENRRVLETVDALAAEDMEWVSDLFAASHRSDVEDYEAGHGAVDELVGALNAHPAVAAARMTGGGFGGMVVALVATPAVDDVTKAMAPRQSWLARPSPGAGELFPSFSSR